MRVMCPVLVFVCIFLFVFCTDMKSDKIIIIGAGAAGIAAATKLVENGFVNLLILEAESRIGGRIHTINLDGVNIDMGAAYCDGQRGNVVYETLEKLNQVQLLERENAPKLFYTSSRQKVDAQFSQEMMNICKSIFYGPDPDNFNDSLGAYDEMRYKELVNEKFKNDPEKLDLAISAINYIQYKVQLIEGSNSWYDVAAIQNYTECSGYNLVWKNTGFVKFLDILQKIYPDPSTQLPIGDKILLNKEVTKITYNSKNLVKLKCSDGTEYSAKHVIVTVSLGVLKNKAGMLFDPDLSKSKTLAIRNIGIGSVAKVFLKYNKTWWGDSKGYNFIWTETDKNRVKIKFPSSVNSKQESWVTDIYQILPLVHTNIVLIWFSGDIVPFIEKIDINELQRGIEYAIDLFLGHLYKIEKPHHLIRSNWYSNQHFQGCYSYSSINTTSIDYEEIKKPILNENNEPVILFAGEATHDIFYSTVHGAVESGYREANRIINFCNS